MKKKIDLTSFVMLGLASIKNFQTGCGYCEKETTCEKRDPKVNKAKQGCKDYKHFEEVKK